MGVFITILGLLVFAFFAPWIHRIAKSYTGWLFALIPASGFAYFISLLPAINAGGVVQYSIEWFPALDTSLSFYIDGLSLLMGLLITGIGSFILIFAQGYLHKHMLQGRFFSYLLVFMAAMLGVVTSDNLILLFVFWELTSISSYMLIGYYHGNEDARRKALQALLVTGLGGVALLAGVIMLGLASESWTVSALLNGSFSAAEHAWYPYILVLVLLGAFTKSAQFPFHFWLPNAMAGPAPVSAYLHSATMVKAGVFLLARLNPALGDTMSWTMALCGFGMVTMLWGAINGLLQTDLKSILAYTTLSVLGMLTMLLGIGTDYAMKSALIFLLGHALYKATLFMTAGSVDHESGTRDVKILGGLRAVMPITAFAAGLAALSKSGFPPFFGFLGKEYVYKAGSYLDQFAPIILIAAVLTNIILMSLALKAGVHPYWGKLNKENYPKSPHEAPLSMYLGPVVLAVTGLLIGMFPGQLVTPLLSPAASAVAGHPVDIGISLWHGFNLPLLLSILTLAGGLTLFALRRRIWYEWSQRIKPPFTFDDLYMACFNGFVAVAKWQTRLLQSGYLRRYLLITFTASLVLISYKLSLFGGIPDNFDLWSANFIEWATAIIIISSLIVIVKTQSRMTALLAMGVTGFGVAIVFILYGAPDVAITQILVETLTLVLFMLVIYRLPAFRKLSGVKTRIFDGIFSVSVGLIITLLVLKAQNLDIAPTISGQFGEWSYLEAKGRNVVNVILVDFRALDTLGEIVVVGIAALGIFALVLKGKGENS